MIGQLKPLDRQIMLLYLDDLDTAQISEVPGTIALVAWNFFGDPHTRGTSSPWVVLAILVVWIVFALIYERFKAAQLQREIDALSSLGTSASRQAH